MRKASRTPLVEHPTLFPSTDNLVTPPDLVILDIIAHLPPLPPVLRYYDDFDDKVRSINHPGQVNIFEYFINGSKVNVDFSRYGVTFGLLMKHLVAFLFSRNLMINTIYNYVISLHNIEIKDVVSLLEAGPTRIKHPWELIRSKYSTKRTGFFEPLKWLLKLLCEYNLHGWSNNYHQFISEVLPSPTSDKLATVRTGEAFLTAAEEAAVVRYFDDRTAFVETDPSIIQDVELQNVCMLLCAYQFAMRPLQIGMLSLRDVRIWQDTEDGPPSVHLTFRMVKQRDPSACKPMTRRVKREWVPLFVELVERSIASNLPGESRLFQVKSSHDVSLRIRKLASTITGSDTSATDLRHTAAQRLVDAGASQEEVAEFLGHSDIKTCLAYFQSSANQAERVNKALGISSIYQSVVKIAFDRFISYEEMAQLKGDQQVAGVPHGIAIAGIGGCTSGQPDCPFNPITSCYGCRKFMPVNDASIHKQVLEDMRAVVKQFYDSSRGEDVSPAYLQLKRTISGIQSVIDELEKGDK